MGLKSIFWDTLYISTRNLLFFCIKCQVIHKCSTICTALYKELTSSKVARILWWQSNLWISKPIKVMGNYPHLSMISNQTFQCLFIFDLKAIYSLVHYSWSDDLTEIFKAKKYPQFPFCTLTFACTCIILDSPSVPFLALSAVVCFCPSSSQFNRECNHKNSLFNFQPHIIVWPNMFTWGYYNQFIV